MAQTFTTSQMGAAANDGSGAKIRTGGLLIAADLEELFTRVTALEGTPVDASTFMRGAKDVAATGAPYQVILFSSEFVSDYEILFFDPEGLGIALEAQDSMGFTINVGTPGNFSYVAFIEI